MLSVQWLLDLQEFKELVAAFLVLLVAFFEDFRHSLSPLWTSNLLSRIVKCCTALLVDNLCVCTLDEEMANKSC